MATPPTAKLAIIDNYDSFTYNLVQYFGELGVEPAVFRNDEVTVGELAGYDGVVISPGPGTPDDAGVSNQALKDLTGKVATPRAALRHQPPPHPPRPTVAPHTPPPAKPSPT